MAVYYSSMITRLRCTYARYYNGCNPVYGVGNCIGHNGTISFRLCSSQAELKHKLWSIQREEETIKSNFVAYQEIDLPSDSKVNAILQAPLGDPKYHEWVVVEKVHGTNFSVYLFNECNTRFARRTGIMSPGENFYGYHIIKDELMAQIKQVAKLLKSYHVSNHNYKHKHCKITEDQVKLDCIVMNGELFGGYYDHPDVAKSTKYYTLPQNKNTKYYVRDVTIQYDAFPQYSPEIHFFAFDLRYSASIIEPSVTKPPVQVPLMGVEESGDLNQDTHALTALGFNEYTDIFSKVDNLLYSKALVRGSASQCINFNVEHFETPIPSLLGLSEFPIERNYAEGIIMRHVHHNTKRLYDILEAQKRDIANTQRNKPLSSVNRNYNNLEYFNFTVNKPVTMLKIRNSAFMEMRHPNIQKELQCKLVYKLQEIAAKNLENASIDLNSVLPAVISTTMEPLGNLISMGRCSNLTSKIGVNNLALTIDTCIVPTGTVTVEQYAQMLSRDCLKDFLNTSPDIVVNMSIQYRKTVVKQLYFECLKFVRKNWLLITRQK